MKVWVIVDTRTGKPHSNVAGMFIHKTKKDMEYYLSCSTFQDNPNYAIKQMELK